MSVTLDATRAVGLRIGAWARRLWKLVLAQLSEFIFRPFFWLAFLATLLLAMWVAGQINSKEPSVHVSLYTGSVAKDELNKVKRILEQFSNLKVTEIDRSVVDLSELEADDIKIALVKRGEAWTALHRFSTRRQEDEVMPYLALITSSLNAGRPWLATVIDKGGGPPGQTVRIDALPRASEMAFVPRTIALLVLLSAFILGARSYAREVAHQMVATLTIWPRTFGQLIASKLLVSGFVSLATLLVLVAGAELLLGIAPKPNLVIQVAAQALPIFSSAGLGLCAAIALPAPSQLYTSTAAYFLALVLLSGFLFPLETASVVVAHASVMSPLTYSARLFESWLFYGTPALVFKKEIVLMAIQLVVVLFFLVAASRLARSRF